MGLIKFVRNYNDESTDRGFQFQFYCDRCGTGYRTPFKASGTGIASEALDVAGNLLGGFLGGAADVGRHIHSASWERAHDAAFGDAVEQIKPHFRQCPSCSTWVCTDQCWNSKRGLCKECAPDLGVEMSRMQAQAAVSEAQEAAHAASSEKVTARDFDQVVRAVCPRCGAAVSSGKFCAECGAPLAAEKFCTECGGKIAIGAKFCANCGARQPGKG